MLLVSLAAILKICKLTPSRGPIYGDFFLEFTMSC